MNHPTNTPNIKDNAITPKNEVLELQPEDKPEPARHVMPESIRELLEVVKIESQPIALRLYILGAAPDIIYLSDRVADLEAQARSETVIRGRFVKSFKEELTQLKDQIAAMREENVKLQYEVDSLVWTKEMDKLNDRYNYLQQKEDTLDYDAFHKQIDSIMDQMHEHEEKHPDKKASSTNQDPRPAPTGD